ncbi:hypothetical protein FACS1894200_09110 [Spirochaetia bacterium]|nr:hypothetical protein FACS1894200_09110 [Spirochaetia bacterium]
MPLQKLVGNVYSVLIEILLWIFPVIGAVTGYIVAENTFYVGKHFLGIILGIIAGLLLDVILFGPVMILLNIRASLKNIENK